MGATIPILPVPAFVSDANGLDPKLVLADMIAEFEAAAGRTLQPAQVERLLINLYAYRETLVRNAIQYAGQQNLLAYASFPMIDYLGQLLGVNRLPAQSAVATLEFTLAAPLTVSYVVPAGTTVGTSDAEASFVTDKDLVIAAGQTTGTMTVTASAPGTTSNGYAVGNINVLLNANPLIQSVSNTTISSGGASQETDDHLRGRIQSAPNQFSVAGPDAAYRFFAMGVDPSIIDVEVFSPSPGTVNVAILTGPITTQPATAPNSNGIAGAALVAEVAAALSADTVRPLTDTVVVRAVQEIDYTIAGTITLYTDAEPVATMAAVNTAAQNYAIALASRIQRDIVPSEIIEALSVSGVYEVVLTSPTYTSLAAGQWANCTAITLTEATGPIHS